MADEAGITRMIHFECGNCGMEATLVDTATARQAWRDHMLTHAKFLRYRSWTWAMVPLEFD